ncbi:MAG: alpha/beta hydrolase [Myxococcota bacterium]
MIPHSGGQLWADVRWRNGWRVQTHSELPLNRLLDPSDRTHKHGSLEACEEALSKLAPATPPSDHLVVLLHGLGRTRRSMRKVDRALAGAGLTTARLDYPSARDTIDNHAHRIGQLLDNLSTPNRLSFVTHSLGGLIVRKLLERDASWRSNVYRIVMFAPPNQGASMARTLDNAALRLVMGPSFKQIVDGIPRSLPVPDAPTSIVAGEIGSTRTDGLVTVAETKLDAMAAHHVVPSLHTFVMNHPEAITRTVSFLASPDLAGGSKQTP